MKIRLLEASDDRMAVSHIYEESWKYAYKGLLPQSYLDEIPVGRWASSLDREGMNTFVLLDGERYAGVCGTCKSRFSQFPGYGEIVSIYLLPEYMGRGCGKDLLKTAVDCLAEQGYQKIFLWVLEENLRARKFYESAGFVPGVPFLEDNIGGKNVREVSYCRDI